MPNQTLEMDGIAFEIVEDQSVGEFLFDANASQASNQEPGEDETEVQRPAVATPRRATQPARVEVIVRDPAELEDETPKEDFTDEELDEIEAELDEWVDKQLELAREEGKKSVQSVKDKEVGKLSNKLNAAEQQILALQKAMEDARLEGLTDEERDAYINNRDFESQRNALKATADELDEILKAQVIVALVDDYAQYGVSAEDLEEIDEPEDMERFCERAELKYYRDNRGAPAPQVQATNPATRVAQTREVTTNQRVIPAGARAPSDLGGGAAPSGPVRGKPADGRGVDAMAQTLNSLPYETVRIA